MDRDTFDATIRAFKHRAPFRPFTVAMIDGDRLEVDHPELRWRFETVWLCSPAPAAYPSFSTTRA